MNLIASETPLSDAEADELDRIGHRDERANKIKCRTAAYSEAPSLSAMGPVRPIITGPGMTRRSTNISLGRALKRAVEIPIEAMPLVTGVLGDSMIVHSLLIQGLASEALRYQRVSEDF